MRIRTELKAGKLAGNHNDAMTVRTSLRVRTTLKAGGHNLNHNEALRS
jgi:hypothetical protein